ncbi:MAG TPA: DUF1697 domain-containing protein [Candidatus Acidoferrum sp.]|nr:DUF1697 domain-containing protein [Candidatus Acidoferrum sp.]
MRVYIALLRGINVGGNMLKMDRLREICADLGLKNARTYLQSGNIVFEAGKSSAHWIKTLEGALDGECRLPVSVIIRTAEEISRTAARNPFLKEKGIDMKRLGVTFLRDAPLPAALKSLSIPGAGNDRFFCSDGEIYLHCPGGFGETKLSNGAFERLLSVRATTRNWNTVTSLTEMAAG